MAESGVARAPGGDGPHVAQAPRDGVVPMQDGHHHGDASPMVAAPVAEIPPASATDPVCGMTVAPATAQRAQVAGKTYYFCSSECRIKFLYDARRFVAAPAQGVTKPLHGAVHTCPMHPQIRQIGPGLCPICGMALEPEHGAAGLGPNAELADMRRRFWISLVLALPVFLLDMGGHLADLHMIVSSAASRLIQFALATPVVLWGGWPFFQRAWYSLQTRNLNMFTLIAMGTGLAWVYSVVAAAAPELFPPAFRGPDGAVAIYFEAAATITVLVLLGQVLELSAREETGSAIRALLDLTPKHAHQICPDGSDEESALPPSSPVTACACARARVYRSTASCWRAAARSMNDDHRRGDAGREEPGRQGDRGHLEPERQSLDARRTGRPRHHAGARCPDGRTGATQPGADRAACRPRRRLVRSAGHCGGGVCLFGVGGLRTGTAPDLRHPGCRYRC